jgi:hypothetical protein
MSGTGVRNCHLPNGLKPHHSNHFIPEVAMKRQHAFAMTGLVAAVFIFGLLFNACQQSTSPDGSTNCNNPAIAGSTGSIAGKVITTGNAGISGVEVRCGNSVSYTNFRGEFFLSNVPAGSRILVNFTNDSYAPTQKVTEVRSGRTEYLEAAMLAYGVKQNLNTATGGTVSFSGASVNFPANAIVDSKGTPFTGSIQVRATYFNPTNAQFAGCFPGEFSGTRTDNSETAIESFGFINVQLLNGTEKMQLAANRQSAVAFPIPATLLGRAPQTIPLWYYDEVKGRWIEEGSATKSGNNYVGSVKHFSSWNCDMPTQTSYLEGHVVDKNGTPISFAKVHSSGVDYTGASNTHTNDSGYFKIAVKSSATAKIQASYFIVSSTPQDIATPATGLILDIGVIVVPVDTMDMCIIVGRLIDNGDRALENMSVQIKDQADKVLDYMYTGKDGKFKFFGELGKTYTIQIDWYLDSAKSSKRIDVVCPATSGTLDIGDIKLDIGGSTLIGRIVDSLGLPLPNVNLIGNGSTPNGQRESRTDSLGMFALWVKPNISFQLHLYYNQKSKNVAVTSGNLGETKNLGDITFP